MLILAIVVVALLIWAAFFVFSYRRIKSTGTQDRESALDFELKAAPWSDRHVESLLARNPDSPVLLSQYVANAVERQDWPEAQRRVGIFAARAPRSPQAALAHIDVLRRAGREEEAEVELRRAIRRMPREFDILLAWAHDAVRREDWPEAARRFERVRRHAPNRIEGYHGAAPDSLLHDDRPDEAEALIAEGLRRLPEAWMMWHTAAWIAERRGDLDEAVGRWEAMRAQFPTEPSGFLEGAETLARAGRGDEAVVLIREAHDFFPGNKAIAEALARLAPPEAPEPPSP